MAYHNFMAETNAERCAEFVRHARGTWQVGSKYFFGTECAVNSVVV